jgi:hypothetical protein
MYISLLQHPDCSESGWDVWRTIDALTNNGGNHARGRSPGRPRVQTGKIAVLGSFFDSDGIRPMRSCRDFYRRDYDELRALCM